MGKAGCPKPHCSRVKGGIPAASGLARSTGLLSLRSSEMPPPLIYKVEEEDTQHQPLDFTIMCTSTHIPAHTCVPTEVSMQAHIWWTSLFCFHSKSWYVTTTWQMIVSGKHLWALNVCKFTCAKFLSDQIMETSAVGQSWTSFWKQKSFHRRVPRNWIMGPPNLAGVIWARRRSETLVALGN